jgi:Cu-Zn family superoxide dismutase
MPTNLVVNEAGRGRLNGVAAATLSAGDLGVFDANGSSIVIHADRDDFVSQPAGASGARVACGVLVAG